MYIGYIKSTDVKEDYQKQHDCIVDFAKDNSIDLSCIYSDSSFENIKSIISADNKGIIVSNVSSFGNTLPVIRDNLYYCHQQKLDIYSISEKYHFTQKTLTESILQGIGLAIDIRYNMTSVVTKAALAKKKESGFKLGRSGKYNVKHAFSGKERELYRLLDSGVSKTQIAKEFGVVPITIYNFLRRDAQYNNYVKKRQHG